MRTEYQSSNEGQDSKWFSSPTRRRSGLRSACCSCDSCGDRPSPLLLLRRGGDGGRGGRRTWRCPGSSPCPCQIGHTAHFTILGAFLGAFLGPFWPFYITQGRRNRLTLTLFRDIISPLTQLCVSLLNSLLRHFLRLTRSTATVKVFLDRPAPVRQTAEPPA